MTTPKQISTSRTPLYRDVGFIFDTIEQCEQAFHDEKLDPQSADHLIYTRYGNPTVIETEQKLATVEDSAWAVLTASGMAAIDVALSIFQKQGETGTWLFFSEIYGGTNTYISEVLEQRRGIRVERLHLPPGQERYDMEAVVAMLDRVQPQLLYFEPVSNPLLVVADGNALLQAAKARGIRVIVDNTFATPYLWRPLQQGADLVVHSVTKYLAGHGNITAGAVCGNDADLRKAARAYRKTVGHIVSPDDAYRLGTQLSTFNLRVATQCQNAWKLAQCLASHSKVENVRYPGLDSHPTHQEAVTLFGENGFGAMITFELRGGRHAVETFLRHVQHHVKFVTTLGDPVSILIHVPTVFTSERFPYPGMIRFSVGFEPYETLEQAVLTALEAIA